jgi:hypothetical protein
MTAANNERCWEFKHCRIKEEIAAIVVDLSG